jgi:hypothetical protein
MTAENAKATFDAAGKAATAFRSTTHSSVSWLKEWPAHMVLVSSGSVEASPLSLSLVVS